MGQGVGMTRTLYSDFESIDDVMSVLDQDLPSGSSQASRDSEPREGWDLSLGYDGALEAYTGGWAEGASKAYELAEHLAPKPKSTRTSLSRSVSGAFPNVGAYLAGAPNAMYRVSKKAAQGRPYVHLYVPISYSSSVHADTAFDRGCAIVALIDALETSGCRVKVTCTRTSEMKVGGCPKLVMRFMVKDYQDRLDIDQLIFTVAHPAFFRRIVFALQERSEYGKARDSTCRGYGTPADLVEDDCPVDGGNSIRVMFPRLEGQHGTPETFLREMVKVLPEDLQTEIN